MTGLQRSKKKCPCHTSLHCLPVAARIKFKTLMLAYRTATDSAPAYIHTLLWIYLPFRSLRSTSERPQRGTKSLSRMLSFTVPGWWNELPTPIRNADSLTIFKQHLKTHLLRHHLISSYKKIAFSFLNLSLSSLYYSEKCLKLCIPSTSCVVIDQNWFFYNRYRYRLFVRLCTR